MADLNRSRKSLRIGIIAEDDSDVEVISELIGKIVPQNSFRIKKFLGRGSGKLRHKCAAWATNLVKQGCQTVLVIHDLDDFDVDELKTELENKLIASMSEKWLVAIPIHEIEAWLLYDASALKRAFRMQRLPKLPSDPQAIDDPKKHLGKLIGESSKTRYVHTIHNKRIAREIAINKIRKSPSFLPVVKFFD